MHEKKKRSMSTLESVFMGGLFQVSPAIKPLWHFIETGKNGSLLCHGSLH